MVRIGAMQDEVSLSRLGPENIIGVEVTNHTRDIRIVDLKNLRFLRSTNKCMNRNVREDTSKEGKGRPSNTAGRSSEEYARTHAADLGTDSGGKMALYIK